MAHHFKPEYGDDVLHGEQTEPPRIPRMLIGSMTEQHDDKVSVQDFCLDNWTKVDDLAIGPDVKNLRGNSQTPDFTSRGGGQ